MCKLSLLLPFKESRNCDCLSVRLSKDRLNLVNSAVENKPSAYKQQQKVRVLVESFFNIIVTTNSF